MAPVADCLQYHTAQYGTIASFGWDTSASTVATSQTHLVSQYYDICIRRTRSYCSICYTPAIISSTTGTSSSYGLGAGSDASAQKSAIGAICTGITIVGSANPVVGVGYGDYLEIANMLPSWLHCNGTWDPPRSWGNSQCRLDGAWQLPPTPSSLTATNKAIKQAVNEPPN